MRRWLAILPLAGLVLLAGLAAYQLADSDRSSFERVERAAPERSFALLGEAGTISFADPPGNAAVVVNLFASWCAPCEVEHPLLTELARDHPDRVYGILYKDETRNGEAFLARLGNPYAAVGLDPDGQGGLDFGLTGVPETFVVGSDGMIRLHIRGILEVDDLRAIETALAGE